jgi:hypothetical protein
MEKSWETARYVENLHSATNKLSADQLQQVFVETDHLLNMSVLEENGCRRSVLNPLQPFSKKKTCHHCGLPLPPGRSEFCSDFCSRNTPKDSCADKRGETEHRSPVGVSSSTRQTGSEMREGPQPNSGLGNRNTECDYYDACLNLAVFEEWESFHCDRCGYRDAYHAPPPSEEPW